MTGWREPLDGFWLHSGGKRVASGHARDDAQGPGRVRVPHGTPASTVAAQRCRLSKSDQSPARRPPGTLKSHRNTTDDSAVSQGAG